MNSCSPYFSKARANPGGDSFGLADRASIYFGWAMQIDDPAFFRIRLVDEAIKSSYMAIELTPTDPLGWRHFAYGAELYGWTNAAEYAEEVSIRMLGGENLD